ncbi:MBL fold metallo-hydrolase [Streptomyces sp. NBC_00893]|uniref:MBL fold metallo-hydrolase n=1 Tax=Streptomyces sp. NBC_00893 TaxID=2975862 RepID=UPI002250BA29|nr:MBL fold metallo-hydrolase [Streptomyces sp. NBC_00893]MCX4852191.1 MBL fold metallo-hydrolase [Streptomyces sp. NBC_00893]
MAGSNTNWVIVKDGGSATLIDSGYPKDYDGVLDSMASVGVAPGDVVSLLITHAHTDHIGAAERLRTDHRTPVLMHFTELAHARRDVLQQVSIGRVVSQAWRPGVLPWAVHALRAGGTADVPVRAPTAFTSAGPLDLPGSPVPFHTPGHTDGHCAYHLPDHGILITGDALVTAHHVIDRRASTSAQDVPPGPHESPRLAFRTGEGGGRPHPSRPWSAYRGSAAVAVRLAREAAGGRA